MEIKLGSVNDAKAVAAVEAACFPAAEAATETELTDRLRYYGSHFWLMWDGEKLAGFVDGMVTNQADLTDELYAQAALHDESGAWQMIFGVNTLPACRRQGIAETLLRRAIADARAQGRRGLVLTCKEHLLHYYAKLGFLKTCSAGRKGFFDTLGPCGKTAWTFLFHFPHTNSLSAPDGQPPPQRGNTGQNSQQQHSQHVARDGLADADCHGVIGKGSAKAGPEARLVPRDHSADDHSVADDRWQGRQPFVRHLRCPQCGQERCHGAEDDIQRPHRAHEVRDKAPYK